MGQCSSAWARQKPETVVGGSFDAFHGRDPAHEPSSGSRYPEDYQGLMEAPHGSQHSPPQSPSNVQRRLATRAQFILPSDPRFTPSVNGRNGWRYENLYEASSALGRGAFGAVFKGTHRHGSDDAPWTNVAIKQTQPNQLDLRNGRVVRNYDDLESFCEEVKVLIRLRQGSPQTSNVLYLYEYFLVGKDVFLITELLSQDLEKWRQDCTLFKERMAIDICRSVLRSLIFLGQRNVVHRDIKLQNVLFRSSGDFSSLKLVDFGLSRVLEEDEFLRDFCGSIGYIPPEIYNNQKYRYEVDMFAFGVLLFRLLSGERPFPHNNSQILKRHTIEYRYTVIGNAWATVSETAKDLVRKLLINREERLTAEQALAHPWFSTPGYSVLRPDLSQRTTEDPEKNRSEAFLLSRPVHDVSDVPGEGSRYWIDSSVELALATIMSSGIYYGRVIEQTSGNQPQGLLRIEEIKSPIVSPIPIYISRFSHYTEKDCRAICLQIAQCINIMHNAGIAHRNLHLGNVVIDPFGKVSIKGLHFAQPIRDNQPLTGHFGFQYSWYAFKAPEVDSNFVHDKSVDLWSLGAIIYMLLTGICPFRGSGMDLVSSKHSGLFDFDVFIPSRPAMELVRGLLQVESAFRLTIDDVLNHEWMIEADDYLETKELELALVNLKDFDAV